MIDRDKYVVFKRDEFQQMMGLLALPPWKNPKDGTLEATDWDCAPIAREIDETIEKTELNDCVVIRKRDIFAAPVLYAYSSSLLTASELLAAHGYLGQEEKLAEIVDHLVELADFFAGEAESSLGMIRKVPD
jgi:hypothetical protein